MAWTIAPLLLRLRPDGTYELDLTSLAVNAWQAPTYYGDWTGNVEFCVDPIGFVHCRGALGGDANPHTAGPACALPPPAGGIFASWPSPGLTVTNDGTLYAAHDAPAFTAYDVVMVNYQAAPS